MQDIHIGPSRQGYRVVIVAAILVPILLDDTRIEARLFIDLAWIMMLFWWWRKTPGLGGPELQIWRAKEGWSLCRDGGESVPVIGLRRGGVSAWLASGELMTPAGPVPLVVPADSAGFEAHRVLRRLLLEGLPADPEETRSSGIRGT